MDQLDTTTYTFLFSEYWPLQRLSLIILELHSAHSVTTCDLPIPEVSAILTRLRGARQDTGLGMNADRSRLSRCAHPLGL